MKEESNMNRRNVLKGIAAAGIGGLAVGTAKGGHGGTTNVYEYNTIDITPGNQAYTNQRSMYTHYSAGSNTLHQLRNTDTIESWGPMFLSRNMADGECDDLPVPDYGVDLYEQSGDDKAYYIDLDTTEQSYCYSLTTMENVSVGDTIVWPKGALPLKYDGSTLYRMDSSEYADWESRDAEVKSSWVATNSGAVELPATDKHAIAAHFDSRDGRETLEFTYLHLL